MQEEVILRQMEINNSKIENIEENQEILLDSLQNKYNQLSKTVGKIHQNVKSNNHKYSVIMEDLTQMNHLMQKNDVDDKILNLLEKLENKPVQTPVQEEITKEAPINFEEYRDFMYKWFNKNIKITKNPHDTINIEEIQIKLDKYFEEEKIDINREKLYNRLESYLKYWYNKGNSNINFKDIISETIKNNKLYSYLKFININEERENRIKNSVMAWLKEHTCEVEGSKTYTEDILRNIQPIFEENGWIITTPEEYKHLQQAGFTKVCVKRTFSQIIGKAVQELYHHITKYTTQRDTPGNGHVTWYPNIMLVDRKISDNVQVTIKDELSGDIFESDNIVCKWLSENLIFTGCETDTVNVNSLMEQLRKYLKDNDTLLGEDTLQNVFSSTIIRLAEHYDVDFTLNSDNINQFKLLSTNNVHDIISKWIDNNMITTDNVEDRVYIDVLDEKLLTRLYKENITIVQDDVYQRLPETLKNNFIQESKYKTLLNEVLQTKLSELLVEGSHIECSRIIEYNPLKRKDITQWVNSQIDQLLKSNVSKKNDIMESFKTYLKNTNSKYMGKDSLENVVDEEIRLYYDNLQNTTLKLLNDSQDEYYVLIDN